MQQNVVSQKSYFSRYSEIFEENKENRINTNSNANEEKKVKTLVSHTLINMSGVASLDAAGDSQVQSEKLTKSKSFDLFIDSILTPPCIHSQRKDDHDETFEEIMETLMSPDTSILEKQISKQNSQQIDPPEQLSTPSGQTVGNCLAPSDKDFVSSTVQHSVNGAEETFDELFDQVITPVVSNQRKRSFREMGTQTSFELATPFCALSSTASVPVQTSNHILKILSNDITVFGNGVTLFKNISKIGTDEWLQSALHLVKDVTYDYKSKNKPTVVEIKNDYDLSKRVKRELRVTQRCEGNTNVYKLQDRFQIEENDLIGNDTVQAPDVMHNELKTAVGNICKNKEFLCSDATFVEVDKLNVKGAIHDIFAKLYQVFSSNQMPCLLLKNTAKGQLGKNGRLQCPHNMTRPSKMNFIHKRSRHKFCRVLYLMGKIYSLLEQNKKLTKREIFYQIKHVINKQSLLDPCVTDVTRLFGVAQWHLNIVAHNGLVYGDLKLFWASGSVTDCNSPATLIPYNIDDIVEIKSTAFFILVVEKESMFHKLLEEDLPNKLARPFIMITGKGVPDVNTRAFLSKLANVMLLPVFILVDADVYGIRIMLTYKFGAMKNCHLSEHLAVPNARWLGVFPSEISKYGMQHQAITNTEKNCIKSLLKYPYLKSYPRILTELQFILNSNRKASIEGLIKNNTFLSELYLPTKFLNQDFI